MNTEYIIVGSANINERSMYLWRVIEIVKWLQVTGAYQRIGFNNIDNAADDGNVHTFRLALWAEHCGVHLPEHLNPTSIECINAMNSIGTEI